MPRRFSIALKVAAFALTIALVYNFWWLTSPSGFPLDTTGTWNFKDGAAWWYCRNTSSGHVWIGVKDGAPEPFFRMEFGSNCRHKGAGNPKMRASLTAPGLSLGRTWHLAFAVPKPPGKISVDNCPFTFSPTYLHRARELLSEVTALQDAVVGSNRELLTAAGKSLARYSPADLRGIWFEKYTWFCYLKLPRDES